MQYKGEDLDLRVPYGRAGSDRAGLDREPAPGRWMRPSAGSGEEPIWVDELVLQCCNYAFELAYSHDAAEVGLEHLVHALSRVDSAARVLEARGVREGQLRRDSAVDARWRSFVDGLDLLPGALPAPGGSGLPA